MKERFRRAMQAMQVPPVSGEALALLIRAFAMGWVSAFNSSAMLLAAADAELKWAKAIPQGWAPDDSWKWWLTPGDK